MPTTKVKNMMNKQIRRTIRHYIQHYGGVDTRDLITLMHTAFNTTKQRISGNLTAMVYYYCPAASIVTTIPHTKSTINI